MKILITGASGQIGKHLIPQLSTTNHKIIALGHDQLDIVDSAKVVDVLSTHQPDLVINLAAYTEVDEAETNPDHAFAVNHQGAANISKAAQHINAAIIHLSTDYVFSGDKGAPYTESDAPKPLNMYGNSKLEGEKAVIQNNPRHVILRTSWVFSNTQKNFFSAMLMLRQKAERISVVDDQIGGPTYAKDIALTIIILCEQITNFTKDDWGIYHYSGSPYTTWYTFAQHIFQLKTQNDNAPELIPIPSSQYVTKARRPLDSRLNNQKIIRRFSIQPSDWQAAVTELMGKSLN